MHHKFDAVRNCYRPDTLCLTYVDHTTLIATPLSRRQREDGTSLTHSRYHSGPSPGSLRRCLPHRPWLNPVVWEPLSPLRQSLHPQTAAPGTAAAGAAPPQLSTWLLLCLCESAATRVRWQSAVPVAPLLLPFHPTRSQRLPIRCLNTRTARMPRAPTLQCNSPWSSALQGLRVAPVPSTRRWTVACWLLAGYWASWERCVPRQPWWYGSCLLHTLCGLCSRDGSRSMGIHVRQNACAGIEHRLASWRANPAGAFLLQMVPRVNRFLEPPSAFYPLPCCRVPTARCNGSG